MCEDVLMSYWCSEMEFRTGGSWKERAQSYLNEGGPGIPLLFYGDAMVEGRKAQDKWKERNTGDGGFLRRKMDRIRGILALRSTDCFPILWSTFCFSE